MRKLIVLVLTIGMMAQANWKSGSAAVVDNITASTTSYDRLSTDGVDVTFDVQPTEGHKVTFAFWNFGDGLSANGVSTAVTHQYKHPDSYTVTLVVAYDDGKQENHKMTVIVSAPVRFQ